MVSPKRLTVAARPRFNVNALKPTFKRVIRLAEAFLPGSVADIIMLHGHRAWRARPEHEWARVIQPSDRLFQAGLNTQGILWIEDLSTHPLGDLSRTTGPWFYAAAAIAGQDGRPMGILRLAGYAPRPYDPEMAAHLVDLAAICSAECGRQQTIVQLAAAQKEALAARGMNEALVTSMPVSICLLDRKMRVAKVNPQWLNEVECRESDVLGRNIEDLFPAPPGWKEAKERCLQGETVSQPQVPVRGPNGEPRWVRLYVAPWRGANGEIAGLLVANLDVTETVNAMAANEQARQRMDIAMRLATFKIWEVDVDGDRYERPEQPKQLRWEAVHEADRDRLRHEWDHALATGETWRTEYRTARGGDSVWLEGAAEQIKDKDGRATGILGIYRDITPRKLAELGLVEARNAAVAANRAKSDFLANMSHEIRTPLNGVLGVTGALSGTELTPGQTEMVGLIETSARTLEALLSDILDLARVEAGRLTIKREPFDLAQSVHTCAALFEASAAAKGLIFRSEIDETAHGVFDGDGPRIRQILCNLLSNATKFTTEGEITLNVRASGEAPSRVIFEVTDTGIGFDAATQSRLFERFEQADASITRRFGGTGLGLSISRGLAHAMGGGLTAKSEPGRGSTFILTLDLERCAEALPAEAPQATDRSVAGTRVLLAEDHPTNRRVVELILGAAGVDLTCVEDGEKAVEAYAAAGPGGFDLVLMDMQMPVMDGLTAIRVIRHRERLEGLVRTPILSLTANAMPEHTASASQAGADGHITKPISADGLLNAVALALSPSPPTEALAQAAR